MTRPQRIALANSIAIALLLSASTLWAASDCIQPTPSIQTLEAAGATIRSIRFDKLPIFDTEQADQNNAIYRLTNRLHIQTRDSAIRSQLLFREGDGISNRLLRETERNLRDLRYLREPVISVLCASENQVDLQVQTRDVWTLSPTLSFGRSGGNSRTSIGIEDTNFLGLGKVLEVVRKSDRNRDTRLLRVTDPNIRGSRYRLDALYRNSDDGDGGSVSFELPFYALDSRHQLLASFDVDESVQTRSIFEEEVDRYRSNKKSIELSTGFSKGLNDGWVYRFFGGVRLERARFGSLPESILALPENRKLTYPFIRVEALADKFDITRNQDQIGRTEDLRFGLSYLLELGQSSENQGSDRTQTLMRTQVNYGSKFGEQQLFTSAYANARLGDRDEQQLFGVSAKYYLPLTEKSKFYASASVDLGKNLYADQPLILGGENGLRGFPFEYQYGSKRALLTLEQRYYTDWKPLQLFQVGAAAFVDVGKVWGDSPVPAPALGTLADFGFGLRLGSLRAARANQLHIDFAYPINGRKEDRGLQILVETKTSF